MNDLTRLSEDIALAQFTRMEKSGNFGAGGRDRVLQHYARVILGLPPRDSLAGETSKKFWDTIHQKQSDAGLSRLTIEELEKKEKEAAVEVNGESVNLDDPDKINEALRKEKSPLRLVSGWTGPYRCLILAQTHEEEKHGFTAMTLVKEIVRTPTAIFPMAAMAGGKQVALRTEAIQNIAWIKWGAGLPRERAAGHLFSVNKAISARESSLGWMDHGSRIRERLKEITLNLYGIHTQADYAAQEKLVIDELVETTLLHELAHAVILNQELTEDEHKMLEESEPMDGTPLSIINEALAEWLPLRGDVQGPLRHMAVLAEKGESEKALRLFFRYLSDSWFFGNPEERYLTAQTEVIVGGMAEFMNGDGTVDFPRMIKEAEPVFGTLLALLKERLKTPKDEAGHLKALQPYIKDTDWLAHKMAGALNRE